ncbi:MAG: 4-hydroxy-tetrahydrodipicolinate reductase [Gemmatimonadota bacterium]|nr:4-hydroxy-tetrahydrodipicolinate reductase [Gemmatimonadota bacterium]
MTLRICLAGVTGWTGSAIAAAVLDSPEFELVGAVARSAAGRTVAASIGGEAGSAVVIEPDVAAALRTPADVLIDYTHPSAVKANVLLAIEEGLHAVIGTSGLTSQDYDDIDAAARRAGVGVVAAGNFSVTAALLKHFSGIAALHVPHWEIVDMAHAGKPDAPSGTARELADYLGDLAQNEPEVPVEETLGTPATRGATLGGAQVHSIRLPSYVISVEALFGLPGERLTIRHDAGSSAEPYVGGTLLAAKAATSTTGLVRGLDTLLFGGAGAT